VSVASAVRHAGSFAAVDSGIHGRGAATGTQLRWTPSPRTRHPRSIPAERRYGRCATSTDGGAIMPSSKERAEPRWVDSPWMDWAPALILLAGYGLVRVGVVVWVLSRGGPQILDTFRKRGKTRLATEASLERGWYGFPAPSTRAAVPTAGPRPAAC
jgi:hypothetical protein